MAQSSVMNNSREIDDTDSPDTTESGLITDDETEPDSCIDVYIPSMFVRLLGMCVLLDVCEYTNGVANDMATFLSGTVAHTLQESEAGTYRIQIDKEYVEKDEPSPFQILQGYMNIAKVIARRGFIHVMPYIPLITISFIIGKVQAESAQA